MRGCACEGEGLGFRGVFHGSRDHGGGRSSFGGARSNRNIQNANNWDKFSVSYFFCNFPFSCESKDLWRAFERLGKVVDVYISKKLTKKGSRFGFVRFKVDRNATRIEDGLNNIWFGSYRLRANISKYDTDNVVKNPRPVKQVFQKKEQVRNGNNFVDGKLFSEVLLNNGHRAKKGVVEGVNSKSKDPSPVISSSKKVPVLNLKATELEWLSNCLVGELKHFMSLKDLERFMEKENIRVGIIRFIGGHKVLFDCLSKDNRDNIFGNFEWWNSWFKWMVPWNSDFSTVGRVAGLKCYGVPLQAWSKETFFDIGAIWGEVLEVNDETLEKINLEIGWVTIQTKQWESISQEITVSLNKNLFTVMVSEVVDDHEFKLWKEDPFVSLEDSSSEDYYSDSVAEDLMNNDESGDSGEESGGSGTGEEVERSDSSVHGNGSNKPIIVSSEQSLGRQISAEMSPIKSVEREAFSANDKGYSNVKYPISNFNSETDISSSKFESDPKQIAAQVEIRTVAHLDNEAEALLVNDPKETSFVPESKSPAHSNNQISVNVSEAFLEKLENISFTVNGIKERGFKSLAEIIANLDSNELDMKFDNKKPRGKKTKERQRKSVRGKNKLQVDGLSSSFDKRGYEKCCSSLNSETERRNIAEIGLMLGVDLGQNISTSLAGKIAC